MAFTISYSFFVDVCSIMRFVSSSFKL